MIALPDLAWMAQGVEDHPSSVARTGTSLEVAVGFGHREAAVGEAMVVHGGHRAVHWDRCGCGLAHRADVGRRRAQGRRLAPEMRLE